MSFDLVRGVNLSEGYEDVGEDAGVFQVDRLNGSSECLGDELAVFRQSAADVVVELQVCSLLVTRSRRL